MNKPHQPISKSGDYKLQKLIALMSGQSRRQAETLIVNGRVRVNGKIATIGERATINARISIDGQVLKLPSLTARLLCYHKPAGKIVERGAPDSVFADLPQKTRWINIGRLDVNSEGLLLFTNDGDLAQRMAHPKYEAEREYIVRIDGELSAKQIQQIQSGVMLGNKLLRPVHFSVHQKKSGSKNQWYKIILNEGRNRAVRRLFAHFDFQVNRLIRLRFGQYQLPRDLAMSSWREMTIENQTP